MTYPQINKAAHCLQALATWWRAPQPEPSIHTARFWSASFFCLPLSPSAFSPPKHTSFYGNKTHHQNGQNSVPSPRADRKQGLNEPFAVCATSRGRRGAMAPHVWAHVWAGAAGPARRRVPSAHQAQPPAPRDGTRLGRTRSIPFCFNIAENCFDSWIASLFITRS